ncbi:SWIM-type domain-containing protein [Gammaproteobacteria bacterium]
MGYYGYGRWPKYVPVAKRRQQAEKKAAQLIKQGKKLEPVNIEGRTIAKTYWGKSWCENLESYSDYENRLPRGRTYVRNGSVIDLKISAGSITALVGGSSIYTITIDIASLAGDKWQALIKECSGKIDSIIELLKGKFSKSIMEVIARKEQGLFPHPSEIKINCSCPDYAEVCKHVAAVFYGVGARLDTNPELLFTLRQVDPSELIITDSALETLVKLDTEQQTFASDELSNIFGIDIDTGPAKLDTTKATKNKDNTKKLSENKTIKPKVQKTKVPNKTKKIEKYKKMIKSKPKKRIKAANIKHK